MQSTPKPTQGQETSSQLNPPPPTYNAAAPKPLCTSCAYPTSHIYTTYVSSIRLGVCPRCNAFLDPLIESPSILLALDLVLLKPRVFLHLLFNRGSPPLDASGILALPNPSPSSYDRRAGIWRNISLLFMGILLAEIAVRRPNPRDVTYVAGRVVVEIATQLVASTVLTLIILRIRGWYPASTIPKKEPLPAISTRDGRQEGFLPSLVPLVLLYTALLPLLLQLILGIWYDGNASPPTGTHSPTLQFDLPSRVGPAFHSAAEKLQSTLDDTIEHFTLLWQESDRVWAGTRILGGMSAGFGLRVLLPTRPWETTAIVMAGWGAAVGAARIWDTLWV